MKKLVSYPIPFNDTIYHLNQHQVDELVKIIDYKGSNIIIEIVLNDDSKLKGHVIDFEGYNPLEPADVYIPIKITIRDIDNQERNISFLDIKSIIG